MFPMGQELGTTPQTPPTLPGTKQHAPSTPSTESALTICLRAARALSDTIARRECRLHCEQQAFRERCQEAEAVSRQASNCRYLDVGGAHFHTSGEVLRRQGPHLLSVLAADEFPREADGDGYLFIDRDPRWFCLVLNYLRHGTAPPLYSPVHRSAALREAEYYSVQGVCRLLRTQASFVAVDKSTVAVYDINTGVWDQYMMPGDWRVGSCCSMGGVIYFLTTLQAFCSCGMFNSASNGDTAMYHPDIHCRMAEVSCITDIAWAIKKFDPGTGRWAHVSFVPVPVKTSRLHSVAGRLVVCGFAVKEEHFGPKDEWGHNDEYVQAFDVRTAQWRRIPGPRVDHGGGRDFCESDGTCFAVGYFWSHPQRFATVARCIPVEGLFGSAASPVWSRISPVPAEMPDAHVVAFQGKVLMFTVVGFDCAAVYDPITAAWSPFPSPPRKGLRRWAAAVVNGTVVVIGGAYDAQSWGMDTYSWGMGTYSAATGWATEPIAPPPIEGYCCCFFLE